MPLKKVFYVITNQSLIFLHEKGAFLFDSAKLAPFIHTAKISSGQKLKN